MTDPSLEALIILASVRTAITNGVRHYDEAGRLLRTEADVLSVLHDRQCGFVRTDSSFRVERVQWADVFAELAHSATIH